MTKTLEALLKTPATALALTKRLLYRLDDVDFAQGISLGVTTNVESRATDEFRAGVRNFLTRSRPA